MKDNIFSFVLGEALSDATNRVYPFLSEEEKKKSPKERDKIVAAKKADIIKVAGVHIRKYIDSILDDDSEKEDFYATANKVCNAINEKFHNDNFNFGHAQKLINMTAKYLYITNYVEDSNRCKFKCFHCPLDSKMKKIVIDRYKEYSQSSYDYILHEDLKQLKNTFWSKLSVDESGVCVPYNTYQKMVNILCKGKRIFPIEYDFLEWNYDSLKELNDPS